MVAQELTTLTAAERGEKLIESLFGASLATMEVFAVYLGDRLGYYTSLAESGEATSTELAQCTNTNERYTREWLEQQAMAGVLNVEDTGIASTRRSRGNTGHSGLPRGSPWASRWSPSAAPIRDHPGRPGNRSATRRADGAPHPKVSRASTMTRSFRWTHSFPSSRWLRSSSAHSCSAPTLDQTWKTTGDGPEGQPRHANFG